MRADLQGTDGSALLVASPDEFRPFFSEDDAYRWLQPFAGDPSNVSTLRRALSEHFSPIFIGRLSDHDVLRQVARLIARACVAVDLRTLPATMPGLDPDSGEAKDPEKKTDLTEVAEEESEFEETKPEPIIPPEFPRMAKREAKAVDFSARSMGALLDLLRFIGENLLPGSKVGEALVALANNNAITVEDEAGGFGEAMAGIAGAGGPKPDPSVVATTLQREANGSADRVVDIADRTGELLASLLAGPPSVVEPSAVAQQMKDASQSQGRSVVEKAGDTAAVVDGLLRPSPEQKRPPSEVGPAFAEAAKSQAGQITEATGKAQAAVDAIGTEAPKGEPPPPSQAGTAMVMESAVAGEAVTDAASQAGETLDGLAETPAEKPKPRSGWATMKLVPENEGLSMANITVRVTIDGEEKLLQTDADGVVELEGVPEEGFDIAAIEDGLGLEVVGVVEDKAGAAPPPPPAPPPPAEPPAETPAEPPAEARDEAEAEDEAPSTERALYPEEDAWLKHTNRIRKARGLTLKTREDIPPEITAKAEERRARRARRKKKRG